MPESNTENHSTIKAAWIGAAALVVAAIIGAAWFSNIFGGFLSVATPTPITLQVRVAGPDGTSVKGAKVMLFSSIDALVSSTDDIGATAFTMPLPKPIPARLIVEASPFGIYERDLMIKQNELINANLSERPPNPSFIVRVIDSEDRAPIATANVTLAANGGVFRQVTDSYGIATFELNAVAGKPLQGLLSVSMPDYSVTDQWVTFQPDIVQDIVLNRVNESIAGVQAVGDPLSTAAIGVAAPQAGTVATSLSTEKSVAAPTLTPTANATAIPAQQSTATPPTATPTSTSTPKLLETPTEVSTGISVIRPSVAVATSTSERVDLATGIRVVTETSDIADGNGEIRVIVRTPDDDPFANLYVAVFQQEQDLNGKPLRGKLAAEFRTDATGSAIAKLPPGIYGIWTELSDVPWDALNFNKEVKAGMRTTVSVVPSQLTIAIYQADRSLLVNSYVSVSTQKADLNGKSLVDRLISEKRTRDVGDVTFTLYPGTYAINLGDVRGSDWGGLDHEIPPATHVRYDVALGRIRIEARDAKGDASPNFYTRVRFQKRDVNDKIVPGDVILEGRTNDTGVYEYNLTPGHYYVESETYAQPDVEVKPGQTITLTNTDLQTP